MPESYIWDHGGFVGVLAAGGPKLIEESRDLSDLIGVSFARVMRADGGTIRSDPTDIVDAFDFALRKNIPVVNVSLRVQEELQEVIFPKFREYSSFGLTVAAAGNTGLELKRGSSSFPASTAAPSSKDELIVVGGVQRVNGKLEKWPDSSWSSSLVDIAAPSVDIRSLDGEGNFACYLGTSVAAPQVAFTAATLHSFGVKRPAEIKRRILATADMVSDLEADVRDGRVLNVAHALDVFVDLVWLSGSSAPMRVEILPSAMSNGYPFVKLCESGAGSEGWIDLSRLHYWERREENSAVIWHDDTTESGVSDVSNTCVSASDRDIRMRTSRGEEKVSLDEIARIVPTRFRLALDSSVSLE